MEPDDIDATPELVDNRNVEYREAVDALIIAALEANDG